MKIFREIFNHSDLFLRSFWCIRHHFSKKYKLDLKRNFGSSFYSNRFIKDGFLLLAPLSNNRVHLAYLAITTTTVLHWIHISRISQQRKSKRLMTKENNCSILELSETGIRDWLINHQSLISTSGEKVENWRFWTGIEFFQIFSNSKCQFFLTWKKIL